LKKNEVDHAWWYTLCLCIMRWSVYFFILFSSRGARRKRFKYCRSLERRPQSVNTDPGNNINRGVEWELIFVRWRKFEFSRLDDTTWYEKQLLLRARDHMRGVKNRKKNTKIKKKRYALYLSFHPPPRPTPHEAFYCPFSVPINPPLFTDLYLYMQCLPH